MGGSGQPDASLTVGHIIMDPQLVGGQKLGHSLPAMVVAIKNSKLYDRSMKANLRETQNCLSWVFNVTKAVFLLFVYYTFAYKDGLT
jgi:hypothetical protein